MAPSAGDDARLYHNDTYEDITTSLKKAASEMQPNDLQMIPGFKLYDAISAFELGNPKMDTGASFVPLEEEINHHPTNYTRETVLAMIDRLFSAEMAWQNGSTLVQTIFSNLQVEKLVTHLTKLHDMSLDAKERPEILDYLNGFLNVQSWEDVLIVYIIAQLKAASIVIELVQSNSSVVAIDEEFHTETSDYYILRNTPVDLVLRLIDAASKYAAKDSAVTERFVLRASWIHILRQGIPKKHTHIDRALKALEVYNANELPYAPDTSDRIGEQFTTGVESRAAKFCLARPLVSMDLSKSVELLNTMLTTTRDLSAIYSVQRSTDMLGFFLRFASKKNLTLTRVLLKSLVGEHDLLGLSDKTHVLRDITEVAFPKFDRNMVPKPLRPSVELFLSQASACYFDLITIFCQDRGWQREGLINALVSFDSLQVSADSLDHELSVAGVGRRMASPSSKTGTPALEFSSWTYLRKLQIMVWVALMTFEQDLVLEWEYSMMFWYCKKLCEALQQHLGRLKAYFEQSNLRTTEDGYTYLTALDIEARYLTNMCHGAFLIYTVLQDRGLIEATPKTDRKTLERVFALRLQPFESIGMPAIPTLSEYETARSTVDGKLAVMTAKASISAAQSMLKTLAGLAEPGTELYLLKRSVLGYSLAVAALERERQAGDTAIEIKHDGFHWYFPVPQMV